MKPTLSDRSIGSIPECSPPRAESRRSDGGASDGSGKQDGHSGSTATAEHAFRTWLYEQRKQGVEPSSFECERVRAVFEAGERAVREEVRVKSEALQKVIGTAWQAAAERQGYEGPSARVLEQVADTAVAAREYQAASALADLRTSKFPPAWPAKHPNSAPPPPCVKLTRKDWIALQRAKDERADAMRRAGKRDPKPVVIPPFMVRHCAQWQRDPVAALASLGKGNEVAAGRIRRAATGNGRLDLGCSRAKAIVALGVLIWHLAPYEESALARVLAGVPATVLAKLLMSPTGKAYSANSLRNRNHGREAEVRPDVVGPLGGKVGVADAGNCGFIPALEQSEFLVYHQPRSAGIEDWQRGTSGNPCSQYKVVASMDLTEPISTAGPPPDAPPDPQA